MLKIEEYSQLEKNTNNIIQYNTLVFTRKGKIKADKMTYLLYQFIQFKKMMKNMKESKRKTFFKNNVI